MSANAVEAKLPTNVAVGVPDMTLLGQAERAFTSTDGLVVDSAAMFAIAAADLQRVKGIEKRLEESRVALKAPILQAGRGIDDFFRAPLEFCARAETALKASMLTYTKAETAKAAAVQAVLDKAAAEERERITAAAREAADKGDVETAEALRSTADVITAPVALRTAPSVRGISSQKRWKATVSDATAFLKHAAEHPECLAWISIDEGALAKFATATSGRVSVPGVTFTHEQSITARAA